MKSKSLPVKEHGEVPFWFNPYSELYKLVYDEHCEKNERIEKQEVRVITVGVFLKNESLEEIQFEMKELEELVEVLGHHCAGEMIQRVDKKVRTSYLGSGKLVELQEIIKKNDIDYIVCNNELFPVQFRQIIDMIRIPVVDRTLIVLEIFARHARTKESKLQVQIAEMKYLAPRISSITLSRKNGDDRKNGAYFSKGSGESIYELNQRKVKQRIEKLQKEINKSKQSKSVQIKRRGDALRVILVGYTNAGKTSIMNMVTGNDFSVSNQLFMTTMSRFRKIGTLHTKDILLADTVGFVSNLPSTWIEGFDSTIEEIVSADLILHIVDVSDKYMERKINIVNDILIHIGADLKKICMVYNKVDELNEDRLKLCKDTSKEKKNEIIWISALNKQDIRTLETKIVQRLDN